MYIEIWLTVLPVTQILNRSACTIISHGKSSEKHSYELQVPFGFILDGHEATPSTTSHP